MEFEHQFWLTILSDHLHFFSESLGAEETDHLDRTEELYRRTLSLRDKTRRSRKELEECVRDIIAFKKELLQLRTLDVIRLNLAPTFISHMINEANEYLGILVPEEQTEVKRLDERASDHKLWLTDIVGHLDAIKSGLDGMELEWKHRAKHQAKKFMHLQQKALELVMYRKQDIKELPALNYLTDQSIAETVLYLNFIKELYELRAKHEVLGILPDYMLDHMFREQSYYLIKLGYNLPASYALGGILVVRDKING